MDKEKVIGKISEKLEELKKSWYTTEGFSLEISSAGENVVDIAKSRLGRQIAEQLEGIISAIETTIGRNWSDAIDDLQLNLNAVKAIIEFLQRGSFSGREQELVDEVLEALDDWANTYGVPI